MNPATERMRGAIGAVTLVVLGAILALGLEEWRDTRERTARVDATLDSIADELRANRAMVAAAKQRHAQLVEVLGGYAAADELPPREVYMYGMFNPAPVGSIAWQTARETGLLVDMPLETVLELALVYDGQERYRSLGQAMLVDIMSDVRRSGMEAVLRDRYTEFIPLATDFASRELSLLRRYDAALALFDD